MNITRFKRMLSIHGAELARWEEAGEDETTIKNFIESSAEAKALYEETKAIDRALNQFNVEPPNPALLDTLMAQIEKPDTEKKSASIHQLKPKTAPVAVSRPAIWGGAAALAAAVILFVASLSGPAPIPITPSGVGDVAALSNVNVPDATPQKEIESVLAEADIMAEEEIARQEVLGLWQLASAAQSEDDADIDHFLDELFSTPTQDSAPEKEAMDLWDLFLQGQNDATTQEL